MLEFLMCVLQYLLIMVVLAAIGACGALIGIKLRKRKDAKAAAAAEAEAAVVEETVAEDAK